MRDHLLRSEWPVRCWGVRAVLQTDKSSSLNLFANSDDLSDAATGSPMDFGLLPEIDRPTIGQAGVRCLAARNHPAFFIKRPTGERGAEFSRWVIHQRADINTEAPYWRTTDQSRRCLRRIEIPGHVVYVRPPDTLACSAEARGGNEPVLTVLLQSHFRQFLACAAIASAAALAVCAMLMAIFAYGRLGLLLPIGTGLIANRGVRRHAR